MICKIKYLTLLFFFFFFKQKTAYEIVSGDWSSDVCSSDLAASEVKSCNLTRYPTVAVRVRPRRRGMGRAQELECAVGGRTDSTGGALWKPASQHSRSRSACGSDSRKRRSRTARKPGWTC